MLWRPAAILILVVLAGCGGGDGESAGDPPPAVTLDASPATVVSGTAATLSWTATDATDCTASGGWSGARGTSGTQSTGNLAATTAYTLTCNGAGGTSADTATVTVTVPDSPTVNFTAIPSTVASGAAATLTWSSTNATGCTAAGGWSGAKATSGSQSTGNLTSTTTYTLTCTGAGGSASRTVTVTITPPPPAPTVSLSANPATVASGAASTLAWSSTNATVCTASNGWSGTKNTSGSELRSNLTATTTYTLTCTGAGGSSNQSVTVTVNPPQPTVTLSANPTSVASGAGTMLTWSSSNATSCTASGDWSGTKGTNGAEPRSNLTSTKTYTLTCNGPGGSGIDSATVTVNTGGSSIFPLRVEAGKRYLVTAQGNPFLVQGDAPWLLITNLTKEEAVTYLDDRQAKGFNTLLVELIERNHSINQPANVYGDPPFAPDAGEFSSPPEDAYFDHAEYIIGQARQRGMLVLLTPSYLGFAGRETGWYPAMGRAGNALLREYGQYVATRFQAYDNILWVQGGDYNPADRTRVRAVVDGMLDVETESLHTFHGVRHTSALGWAGTTEPWLEVNNVYADENTVIAESRIEWERATTMPYFLIEAYYEDEAATALETRQQAWQAVLSGNAGQVTGQESVWKFEPGVWPSKLDTEGASTLVHLRTLFEAYAWWTLIPDFDNTFLTAGAGTGAARAPAALAADGSFAFIYTRDIRDLTVDLGDLDGATVQARWYDPTSGAFTAVAGSPFAATGSRVFRPTGANSRGKNDWVLVLDALN